MHIILKRSFPWFPMVLAAGWIVMVGLAISDLAWFAAASASFSAATSAIVETNRNSRPPLRNLAERSRFSCRATPKTARRPDAR